jgi:hypothetical protein
MSSASSNVSDNAWSEHDLRARSSRCNVIDAGTARSAAPISAIPGSGATPQSYRTNGRSGKALHSVPPCAMQSFTAARRLDAGS